MCLGLFYGAAGDRDKTLFRALWHAFDQVCIWLVVCVRPIKIDVLFRVTDRLGDHLKALCCKTAADVTVSQVLVGVACCYRWREFYAIDIETISVIGCVAAFEMTGRAHPGVTSVTNACGMDLKLSILHSSNACWRWAAVDPVLWTTKIGPYRLAHPARTKTKAKIRRFTENTIPLPPNTEN